MPKILKKLQLKPIGMSDNTNILPLHVYTVPDSSKDVTMKELKTFLGMLMNMALNDNTEMNSYCSQSWVD
jgi:hypothetical protein